MLKLIDQLMRTVSREKRFAFFNNATDIHGYQQRDYSSEQQAAIERMITDDW